MAKCKERKKRIEPTDSSEPTESTGSAGSANPTEDEHRDDSAEGAKDAADETENRNSRTIGRHLLDIYNTLWWPIGRSEEERKQKLEAATDALIGIAPKNESERMLAGQMIATHAAAMEHIRRAISLGQSAEVVELSRRYAIKFMDLHVRQTEAFYRNRLRQIEIRQAPPDSI